MAKLSISRQTNHDQRVRQEAENLRRQGWNVRADLTGYKRPSPIGRENRIPDIEANKRGRRKILEIETPDTLLKDKSQHETFRRHAGQKPNTSFNIIVTNKR